MHEKLSTIFSSQRHTAPGIIDTKENVQKINHSSNEPIRKIQSNDPNENFSKGYNLHETEKSKRKPQTPPALNNYYKDILLSPNIEGL